MALAAPAAPPRVVDRFFEFSLLGMLAAGYFAVVGSGYLDWPTAAVTFAGLCLRALMVAGIVEFHFSGRLLLALAIVYIGFYPIDYLYVSMDFLKATVHLVCFLAILKVLTAKTNRDYAYITMLAVLELLSAALFSANMSFFAFLALFVMFAIAAFTSGEVRRSSQLRRAVARGGLRAFPRRLVSLTGFLFVGILAMTAVLFFILPRTARAALNRFVPQRYHLTGFSNSVTLGEIGEIKRSTAAVMHVRSYESDGLLEVRWRGTSFSDFDGRRWFNPPGAEALRIERQVLTLNAPNRPGKHLIYEVHLNDIAADTLFLAGTPQRININLPFLRLTRGGAYRVPRRYSPGGLSYGVESVLEDEMSPWARLPEPLAPFTRKELLELPAIDDRIPVLAREMAGGARTEEEKALQVEHRLRHDYGYTLKLLPASVPDPLANFLFDRKKGHCEYFASAMAVMLRTLGIPSRIVTGFQSGVYNPMTGWQVVRASDAHSWVEAWITGRGWMTFDPTPPDPAGAVARVEARLSLLADAADQFWQDWVLSYDVERQIILAARMDESARQFRFQWLHGFISRLTNVAKSGYNYLPWVALTLLLAFAGILFGPAIGRWSSGRLRVRRLVRGEGRASDATLLYNRMLRVLERRGIRKPPWLTPTEFVKVLPASEVRPLVDDLTDAYNEFRFGGKPDVAPRMVRLLEQLEKL